MGEIILDELQEKAAKMIFIALDDMTPDKARELVMKLDSFPFGYKVGLGPIAWGGLRQMVSVVSRYKKRPLFLDIGLNGMPSAVAESARAIAAKGTDFFSVQAFCGEKAMRMAVANSGESKVLATLVPTSMSEGQCKRFFRDSIENTNIRLACDALDAGCDGVVCSPYSVRSLRNHLGSNFIIVAPGIRLEGSSLDDHARAMTPEDAFKEKVGYLAIGRPVTRSKYPAEAALHFVNMGAAVL